MTATDELSVANEALLRGDWPAASQAFDTVLRRAPSAEALDGLGQAQWWLNNLDQAIELRCSAYAKFVEQGRPAPAIKIAAWLAREYFTVHGNLPAAGGWISRAEAMLERAGPCAEAGWLAVIQSALAPSPELMKLKADEAIDVGTRFDDVDLQIVGLSAKGLAHVFAAEVAEGMALLDEAMAATIGGEVRSFWAFSDVYCNTLLACDRAGDFERAEQWCRLVMELCQRKNARPLFPFCHVTYGAILAATGRWPEAEEEFELALRMFDDGHRGMRVVALARLAELRIRQGRIAEAAVLLEGYEEHPLAIRAATRLLLADARPSAAAGLLNRRLEMVSRESVLAAPLLALLVEAQLAIGNARAATATAQQLMSIAERAGQRSVLGDAEFALGAAGHACGDPAAVEHLDRAIELFREIELPLEEARARTRAAAALEAVEPELAERHLSTALRICQRLGARADTELITARLRELGVSAESRPRLPGPLTARENEVLHLLADGLTNADIARRLFISPKTAEHHVGNLLRKLGLRSRTEAAAYLLRQAAK
jgi:DNA-binding NarL/FixJ family response regulator